MTTPNPSGSYGTSIDRLEMMQTDDDASEKQLSDYVRIRAPLPLGGLPVEVWMMILEITDDPHALLASKCTCITLCDIVDEIVSKRSYLDLDLIAADPTRGYFMDEMTLQMDEILSWVVTYDMQSACPSILHLSGWTPWLRSQTRSALSLVKSVTKLQLSRTHFLSFSDFARTVCVLPNLSSLIVRPVTWDGMDSPRCDLKGVYIARNLRLKELTIRYCAFDEMHPFWDLLTAPSLSDSLESIVINCRGPGLSIPSAPILSANLGRLRRLCFEWRGILCVGCPDVVASNVLARIPSGRLTAIEIDHVCGHSSSPADEWGRMLSIADDAVAVTDFSSLRTITVSLEKNHPFDLQSARAAVDSHLYLPRWTEMFLMSSMSITIYGKQVLEKREGTTEPSTEGIILSISMGPGHEPENRIAVTYTRRGCA